MLRILGLVFFLSISILANAKLPSLHQCILLIRESIHHLTYESPSYEKFLDVSDSALEDKLNKLGDLAIRPLDKITRVVEKHVAKLPEDSSKTARVRNIKTSVAKKILATKKKIAISHTMDLVKSQHKGLGPQELHNLEKAITRLVNGESATAEHAYISEDIRLSAVRNLGVWAERELPYSKELLSTGFLSSKSNAWAPLKDLSFNASLAGENVSVEIPKPKPEDVSPLIRPLIDFEAPPKLVTGQTELRFNVNSNNFHQVADQLANLGPKTANEYRHELRAELQKHPNGFEKNISDFIPQHARDLLGKNTEANCAGAAAYFLGLTPDQKILLPDEAARLFDPKYEIVESPRMGDVVVYAGFGNYDQMKRTHDVFGVNSIGSYSNQTQFRHVAIYMGDNWVWQTPTYQSKTPVIFSNYSEANSGVPNPPGQVYYLRRKPTKP